jgi:hypothetical protein
VLAHPRFNFRLRVLIRAWLTMSALYSPPRQPPDRCLRIYPAHSFAHDDDLAGLINLLKPDWVEKRDYVIMAPRAHDPLHTGADNRQLAIDLIKLMTASDLIWALAGRYATHSPWINFENAFITAIAKPVVAIAWLGQERLSTVATGDGARPVVRWRKDSVIDASLKALTPPIRAAFLLAKDRRDHLDEALANISLTPALSYETARRPSALEAALGQIRPGYDPLRGALENADGGVFGAIWNVGARRTGGVFGALELDDVTHPGALCGALRKMPEDE